MYQDNFQQNQYGYFGMGGYGAQYAQPKKVEMHQALTPEEEAQLRQNGRASLSFKLEPHEMLAGICTHKSNTTKMPDISLVPGSRNRVKCNICHKEWDLIDDPDLFNSALSIVLSGLQTIKTWWIDIPPEMAREYFPIIPLLEKSPAALQMAMECWRSYEQASQVNQANGYTNSFNVWNQMMGGFNPMGQPGFGGAPQYPNYQQPTYQQPQYTYGQPGFDQQQYYGGQPQYSNPMVQNNAVQSTFVPNAGGYAPGMTGTMGNMGQQPITQNPTNSQTTVTNTVEVKKELNL